MKEKAEIRGLGGGKDKSISDEKYNTPAEDCNAVTRFPQGTITGAKPAKIKPGEYDLAYRYFETSKLMGGRVSKLAVWFKVVSMGESFDALLPRYYNVQLIGKPGKYGAFKVGWKSDFIREYAALFGLPTRKDRIPMGRFERVIIRGAVRNVSKSFRQDDIHPDAQYSVIDKLIKVREI